jgi:imidazolonepropionase-like amidohydrolase
MTKHLLGWLLPLLVLLPLGLQAQSSGTDRPPVTRTYLIKNAFVIQRPGTVIDMGSVLIRDGLIEAVGQNISVPADARVLEEDSLYVYAGFIEGLSHTGVPRPDAADRRSRPDGIVPGNPPNEYAGIQPDREVVDLMKADDKSVAEMRQLGFTAAHVVPHGRMLPGKGAIALLSGDHAEEMVLKANTSLLAQYEGAPRVYPATTMAIMSKFREMYQQAEQAKAHEARYAKNPSGMARPEANRTLTAFYGAIDGTQPVFFVAEGVKDIYRTLTLQQELGFPLVIAETTEAWRAVDALKQSKVPVFLSMELPEAKDGDKKEDEEAAEETDPEKAALEARRAETMKKFESQAATLAKAGIPFGFSTLEVKDGDIRANLRRMIAAGLSEDQALAALTTTPAELLGVANMLGTVEQGKIANLVVTDTTYFSENANVRYVFVDGDLYEYEVQKKKKGNPNATANAVGNWAFVIEVPGQQSEGTIEITGTPGDLSGTMTTSEGDTQELSNVLLDGNTLTFTTSFDGGGQSITLSFDLVIEGDTLEGSVAAGSFGSFDVEGERTSTPDR